MIKSKQKHSLYRLTESIYGKPHLIRPAEFNIAVQFLNERNNGKFLELSKEELSLLKERVEGRNSVFNEDTKVGILQIDGVLTYKMYAPVCGEQMCSYEGLRNDFDSMVERGAKLIVLEIDSGGGEAYQAFETANYIKSKAKENGIKLITYVDGLAASAAYVFATIANEVIVNPQAEVGSIGVVCKLMNDNKAYEKMGIETTYVYAGKSKIPFDANGSYSEDFLSELQKKVNSIYTTFIEHVSINRSISQISVIDTQAKTFLADEAITIGLADKKMTIDEYHNYIAEQAEEINTSFYGEVTNMVDTQHPTTSTGVSELETTLKIFKEDNAKLQNEVKDLTAKLAIATSEKEKLEKTIQDNKMQARKEKLSKVVAESQVESVLASTEKLDDDSFNVIVNSYSTNIMNKENSSDFIQVSGRGVSIETKPAEISVEEIKEKTLKALGITDK